MNEAIKIDDLSFEVRRSKRRKTIGVTVERDASLVAHLPEGTSIDQASGLIRTKLVWIHQKLASHEGACRQSIFRRPEFVDGEGFYFLGQHYRLNWWTPNQLKARFQPFASKASVCCSGESRQLPAKSELPSTIHGPRTHT
jgi:predicted metal-dependent hydrolase